MDLGNGGEAVVATPIPSKAARSIVKALPYITGRKLELICDALAMMANYSEKEADQTYFVDFARALESDLRETLRRHVDWSDEGGRDGVA